MTKRIISTVLLSLLSISSSMHGSYDSSSTNNHTVHRIHSKKSKKLRKKKQQNRALLKELAIACGVIGAAGIAYWACASSTNHASYIPPSSENAVVPLGITVVRRPAQPRAPQLLVPLKPTVQPPPIAQPTLTQKIQTIMAKYKIPCDAESSRNLIPRTQYDIGNAQKNLGKTAGMELQEAYAKGLVSALPDAVRTSILKGYIDEELDEELDEKRKEEIKKIFDGPITTQLSTLKPYELIEPINQEQQTGFFFLVYNFLHNSHGDPDLRKEIIAKLSEVISKYPSVVNSSFSNICAFKGQTMCHYIAIYSCICSSLTPDKQIIGHHLFDIFKQSTETDWKAIDDMHKSTPLMLLLQHPLHFSINQKKDKDLLSTMACDTINSQDSSGLTALHHALKHQVSDEIITFLVEQLGADPRINTISTTLQYAKTHNRSEALSNMLSQAIERFDQKEKEAKKPAEPIKGLDE